MSKSGMTTIKMNTSTKGAFHVTDGLFFVRRDNGAVAIIQTDGKTVENGGKLVYFRLMDKDSWISVLADVARRTMDIQGRYIEAKRLHIGKD